MPAAVQCRSTSTVTSVRLFRRRPVLFTYRGVSVGVEHIPFLLLWCAALWWAYQTMGEQYYEALEELELQQELQREMDLLAMSSGDAGAAATASLGGSGLAGGGRFFTGENAGADSSVFKKQKTMTEVASGQALPSQLLPDFWALFALGALATAHLVFVLSQHWSVAVLTALRYTAVDPAELLRAARSRSEEALSQLYLR